MNNQPQSRHLALQPLSRHHHHALVMAQKLMRAVDSEKESVVTSVVEFWEGHGNQHFIEEETLLLPTFARFTDIHRSEIIQMLLEHVEIRAMIQSIRQETQSSVQLLHVLGEKLKNHVRFEERVVFPLIQEIVPENVLVGLPEFTEGA